MSNVTAVLLTGAVWMSSVFFTASCSGTGKNASENEQLWSHVKVDNSITTSFHSLRENSYTGIDSNGNILVSGMLQRSVSVIDSEDGSLKGSITVDTYEPSNTVNGWLDSFAYVVNGRAYLEINEIPDEYQSGAERISSSYYSLDTEDMSVIGRQMLFDDPGMVTVGCWTTAAGTCLIETDDPWLVLDDSVDRRGPCVYCFKDDYDPIGITLEDYLDDLVMDVRFVVSLDPDVLIVSCLMRNSDIRTLRIGLSQDDISVSEEGVPSYLKGQVTAYNGDDGLYVCDMRGAYTVASSESDTDAPSFEKLIDWSRCDQDISTMASMIPYGISEEGEIRLLGIPPQSLQDETCKIITATAVRCGFPYGERQEITVGCLDYIPDVIAQNIAAFNESDDEMYLRAVLISPDGLEPTVDISQDDDPFDLSYEQKEAMKMHAYEDYLRGNDVPDIVITDGMYAQLQDPEIFTDLKSYMDQGIGGYNRDDYMDNVFELSQVGNSVYTLPIYYYVYGLVEISMIDFTSVNMRRPQITSIDFDEYELKKNEEWGGIDPLSDFMGRERCFDEMLCTQYTDFVDLETDTADFEGESFVMILDYAASLESNDDNIYYYDYTQGNDIYVEYASLCYSTDISMYSLYIDSCTWMGLPTADGNTPSIGAALTCGITNQSDNKDEAWGVLMYLISEDAQKCGKDYFGLPVNIEVARSDFTVPNYAFDFVEELTDSATRMYYFDCDMIAISTETVNAYADGDMDSEAAGDCLGAHVLLS